jgi:hypothetical protein
LDSLSGLARGDFNFGRQAHDIISPAYSTSNRSHKLSSRVRLRRGNRSQALTLTFEPHCGSFAGGRVPQVARILRGSPRIPRNRAELLEAPAVKNPLPEKF